MSLCEDCVQLLLSLVAELMCLIDELLALLQDAKRTVSMVNMADSVKVKYTIKQLSKDAALGQW